MKRVTVVTTSRADYGIYGPVLRRIEQSPELSLDLMVTGSHLSPLHGMTVDQIVADGFPVRDRIECLLANDTPVAIAQSMALTILGFSQAFARESPELLLLLGDRFEMFAAASAAVPFRIPMAHIHGGEVTEGAMDEAFRHAITKMSHLHFAATEAYRQRIIQLGESPDRVFMTGAPSLDNLSEVPLLDKPSLEKRLGLNLSQPPVLITFHPVTLQSDLVGQQIAELLEALAETDAPLYFTYPNADTNGQVIIRAIDRFVAQHSRAVVGANLGTQGYFSLMKHAAVMVGNSSSGIIEAASFGLPVVNIGIRQKGRVRGENVIDCAPQAEAIATAISQAVSAPFRKRIEHLANPYGGGNAAGQIVDQLARLKLDDSLLLKPFHDVPRG